MAHRPAFALSSAHRSRPSISPSGARRSLVSQLFACCLCLLLFTNMLSGWDIARAKGKPPGCLQATPANLTLQQFLQEGRDDRHDPFYCSLHDCSGTFAYPDDRAWSVQAVEQITTIGRDSSGVTAATTTYAYTLAITGSNCPLAGSDSDCVGDDFIPQSVNQVNDQDWMDFYHAEYRGFKGVFTTSPANNLTVGYYFSTDGWWKGENAVGDYLAGNPFEEDSYSGNSTQTLLRQTTYAYDATNPCNGTYTDTYIPCEVILGSTKTYDYEGAINTSAPSIEYDYSYDDYNGGLTAGYHNLTREVITSSNAAQITKQWSYATNNQTFNNWVYDDVNKVSHSEVDTSNPAHVWACQDFTYDPPASHYEQCLHADLKHHL